MFNPFSQKKINPNTKKLKLKIDGMHCMSCAMTIDGALEDTDGVLRAETSYAKNDVSIEYDPKKVDEKKLQKVIQNEGYEVVEAKNS